VVIPHTAAAAERVAPGQDVMPVTSATIAMVVAMLLTPAATLERALSSRVVTQVDRMQRTAAEVVTPRRAVEAAQVAVVIRVRLT